MQRSRLASLALSTTLAIPMIGGFAVPAFAAGHGHGNGNVAKGAVSDTATATINPKSDSQTKGEAKGNGANASGPYDSTPSTGDNQGNGNAPANGSVGNADDKNPPGQQPGGSDHNNGYECDGNHGVGDNGGNPAHTGCTSATPTPTPTHTATPTPTPTHTVTPKPTPTKSNGNDKITICHATGSSKHPYVTITVDKNGLNGHGDHAGDIIPAPAAGCPAGDSPTPTPTPPSPTPTPPVDACPDIYNPGMQAPGTVCTLPPPVPPVDACPDQPGVQVTGPCVPPTPVPPKPKPTPPVVCKVLKTCTPPVPPKPPVPPVPPVNPHPLPYTGSHTDTLLPGALAALMLGTALMVAGRRKRVTV